MTIRSRSTSCSTRCLKSEMQGPDAQASRATRTVISSTFAAAAPRPSSALSASSRSRAGSADAISVTTRRPLTSARNVPFERIPRAASAVSMNAALSKPIAANRSIRTFCSAPGLSGSTKPCAMPSASSRASVGESAVDSCTTSRIWPFVLFQMHSAIPYCSRRRLRSGAAGDGKTFFTSAAGSSAQGSPAGALLALGVLPVAASICLALSVASRSTWAGLAGCARAEGGAMTQLPASSNSTFNPALGAGRFGRADRAVLVHDDLCRKKWKCEPVPD